MSSRYAILFWEGIFSKNIMLSYFLGVLLLIVKAEGFDSFLKKGCKYTTAIFSASFIGLLLVISLGIETIFLSLWIFLISSLLAVYFLQKTGELQKDFFGLPEIFLMLVPMLGLQIVIYNQGLNIAEMTFSTGGSSLGFYITFIIMAGIKEKLQNTEANIIKETGPSLLMAFAFLSLAVIAFVL